MANSKEVWCLIDKKAPQYFELADRIWHTPELNFLEIKSAAEHGAMLEAEGFYVSTGHAGMPTAVIGEAGHEGPVIAILGEYDALPGLSQEAGISVQKPIIPGGNGHGCGHHILGSASLLAAAAVKDHLAARGLKGRVRYYGCPAEEGGSAKGFMVRAGLFDDVDVAICWHPGTFNSVIRPFSLACVEIEFNFYGRASHAASQPHLGRSALDAVELMHVGVNYMREHMPSTARIHYAVTNTGGAAPNVVQAHATTRHLIRAATLVEMWDLVERVKEIAQGAAQMSGTRVEARQFSGDANLIGNLVLEEAMQRNLEATGGPGFDDADRAYAAEIQKSIDPKELAASYTSIGLRPRKGEVLSEEILPLDTGSDTSVGSTDVGSVSWVVPTVQCRTACYAVGTPGHSWQMVAQGLAPAAHKGMALAAKAMAGLAADLIDSEALLREARIEFETFRAENPFRNPLTDDIEPPLDMSR
jgi:aminobenzoyl-glutamate utilization protein B